MPTVRTVTVKPSGGDYTGLIAAEAGEQGDFVALDRQLDIACYAMDDNNSTHLVIDGSTADATRYMRIYTPSTERHDGKWNTGKYQFRVTSGWGGFFNGFQCDDDYIRVEGLQISAEVDSGNSRSAISWSVGSGCNLSYNIIRVIPGVGQTGHSGAGPSNTNDDAKAWNNVIYMVGGAITGSVGITSGTGNFNHNFYCYNNTVYGFETGIKKGGGNAPFWKNNLCNGNTTDYSGTPDASSVTNLSEDATSPNSALRSKAVTFVNEGAFDLHLDATDTNAKDAGTNLSADSAIPFSDDINGRARWASDPWDVGADELVKPSIGVNANYTLFPKYALRTQ